MSNQRKSAIPMAFGVTGLSALVLSAGACGIERSLDPEDILGVWAKVEQRHTDSQGMEIVRVFPKLSVLNYSSGDQCYGHVEELELRVDGSGALRTNTHYDFCGTDVYSVSGYEIRWEDVGGGKFGVFIEGDLGDYYSTSSESDSTTGAPVPLPDLQGELVLTCTVGSGRLSCTDELRTGNFNLRFEAPECASDDECPGGPNSCFGQQCIVPTSYSDDG